VATVRCRLTASIGVAAFDGAGNRASITSVRAFTPAC